MRDWKKIGGKLLFPHPAVTALLAAFAFALLIYGFLALNKTHPLRIGSYALSFYALVIVCLRLPSLIRYGKKIRQENPYLCRYAADVRLRMNLSLLIACGVNSAYALFQLCLGIRHHSAWFYAMAGYYFLLGLMRLMLIRYTGKHAPGERQAIEWKKYRICGVCLLTMTLALTIFIIYFIFRIREFAHHEITTIAMAAYTFSALTMAIINTFRYRRYGSPVYSAAKAISLVSAVVSVLTLENAMLTAFGRESSELFRRIMLGMTGLAVVSVVQCTAIYMIGHAKKMLKAHQKENDPAQRQEETGEKIHDGK